MADQSNTPALLQSRAYWWILLFVGGVTFALDQFTKWLIVQHLAYGETWVFFSLLDGIFDLTYTRNTGAAFGMGQGQGNVFLLIALVVSAIIVFSYRQLPDGSWPVRIAMGMMMGGALGNAIDRVRFGYVVDFFHLHGWPIFNVADSAIVLGVGIWMIAAWWEERQQPPAVAAEPSTEDSSHVPTLD